MELYEMKPLFKKWEVILNENVNSLTSNKDHPNGCLVYMLYCLPNQKPFNLAYYMVKRVVGVIKSDKMVPPYGMILTRLYRHVSTIQPCPLTDGHFIVNHVMVPLTKRRVERFMVDEKRPHPPTSFSSSSQSHDEIDPVDNYQLSPITYHNQLPPILGALEEFKQTKGMFKCIGHFLSNMGKKRK
ncbi:hypothetical protein Tco_1311951 [Tanacetum coccineum]